MKRNTLVFFYFLVFLLPLSVAAEGVNQTKVHIYGIIQNPTCNVVNSDIYVDFGNIIDKELYARKRTSSIPFTIKLDKCDLTFDHDVIVTFIGNESLASDLQGFLAIDELSTATGIAIGIENMNGKLIPLREESHQGPIRSENMLLHFNAFISAERQAIQNHTIGLGSFTATATFHIEYE
ncbi:TPA: fimbrial protein [Morganella morganii]|nr:fimbrial protein [Morganella morganii]EBW4865296.1 type 1 fimbrial protein [Salmonella enterica subsp. enterica serovar Oranienburg]MBT0473615.1 type 1 fimbrial protein [Morganella morganii subsp. morganii]UMW89875.1 hypothetical protein [Morganella morganii]HCT1400047.1 type 1 fimbrial protein [Morganella morganii]